MKTEGTKTAAIYVRVSTYKKASGKQTDNIIYLQNPSVQEDPLRKLCSMRGWEVHHVYSDRMSGSRSDRPGYQKLLEDARRGLFNVVVVWRFDRWARSTKELLSTLDELKSIGVDFVSHNEAVDTSTPMGKFMYTILGALAEMERDIIRERIRAGIEYARANGTKTGGSFGRPRVVFHRDRALDLRAAGRSWSEIAAEMQVPASTIRRACQKSA